MSTNTAQIKLRPRGRKTLIKKIKRAVKPTTLPSRTKTPLNQGIYISPPRIKSCLDSAGINKGIQDAVDELRRAEPHEEPVLEKTGKKTDKTYTTDLVAWDNLSEATRGLVAKAKSANEVREHEQSKREQRQEQKDADAKAPDTKDDTKEVEAKRVKRITKYSVEIELLSKMRIRFSKDGPQQVAATICAGVHELSKFAIDNALRQERKIVKVRHALHAGYENLKFACMYQKLDSFKAAVLDENCRLADEQKRKDEKKLKIKGEPEVEPEAELEPEVEVEDDSASFGHYVKQVCQNLMNEEIASWTPKDKKDRHPYEDIRISLEYREFISQLIVDFVRRFCPLLRGQISAMGIKTISREVIRQTVNLMLEFNGVDSVSSNVLFDSKFDLYKAWLNKRKVDKARSREESEAEQA